MTADPLTEREPSHPYEKEHPVVSFNAPISYSSPAAPDHPLPKQDFGAELGHRLPAHLPHAISVSFPTWEDNLGYVSAEPRVMTKMKSGYPRFKVHYLIEEVSAGSASSFVP